MIRAPRISKEEKAEWILSFLYRYAKLELINKYIGLRLSINFELIGKDKRRIPTIISFLKEMNLIKEGLKPNLEEIEKIIHLPKYNGKPKFNDILYKNVYHKNIGYIKQRIINKDELFLPINIGTKEVIYIYNNQDQFVFKIKDLYNEKNLCVISKEIYNNINEIILKDYAKEEIDEDPNSVLSYAFGVRFRTLNNYNASMPLISLDNFTKEKLSKSIPKLQNTIEILKRRSKETKILNRYMERLGYENFRNTLMLNSFDYIKSIAPLWIMKDNKKKIKIAKIVLEGLPEQ